MSSRMIKVKKEDLIKKIEENKETHITEYEEAVIAYKNEALKQLKTLTKNAKNDKMDLQLQLVTPVDNTEKYDKLVVQFDWEVEEEVELSQSEFNQYVHDDTEFARSAKFYNSTYTS